MQVASNQKEFKGLSRKVRTASKQVGGGRRVDTVGCLEGMGPVATAFDCCARKKRHSAGTIGIEIGGGRRGRAEVSEQGGTVSDIERC